MAIGVLALQGAFREHKLAFERLGHVVREVRIPSELEHVAALVIPGGESTTMTKLMQAYGFDRALPAFYASGKAIWGTCAGAIAIAKDIVGYPEQFRLGIMDISVERNAYGRQVNSFEVDVAVEGLSTPFHTIFIRAPRIAQVGAAVTVLASYGGDAIMVQQGRLLATVFHPELSGDDRIHQYFAEQVALHTTLS